VSASANDPQRTFALSNLCQSEWRDRYDERAVID
jgi:hypothetical protein